MLTLRKLRFSFMCEISFSQLPGGLDDVWMNGWIDLNNKLDVFLTN